MKREPCLTIDTMKAPTISWGMLLNVLSKHVPLVKPDVTIFQSSSL